MTIYVILKRIMYVNFSFKQYLKITCGSEIEYMIISKGQINLRRKL